MRLIGVNTENSNMDHLVVPQYILIRDFGQFDDRDDSMSIVFCLEYSFISLFLELYDDGYCGIAGAEVEKTTILGRVLFGTFRLVNLYLLYTNLLPSLADPLYQISRPLRKSIDSCLSM